MSNGGDFEASLAAYGDKLASLAEEREQSRQRAAPKDSAELAREVVAEWLEYVKAADGDFAHLTEMIAQVIYTHTEELRAERDEWKAKHAGMNAAADKFFEQFINEYRAHRAAEAQVARLTGALDEALDFLTSTAAVQPRQRIANARITLECAREALSPPVSASIPPRCRPGRCGERDRGRWRNAMTETLASELSDHLQHDHPATPIKASVRDFRWLIEAPGQRYLAVQRLRMSDNFVWTSDHNAALAFRSKEQAEALMMAVRQMDREFDSYQNGGKLSWGKLFSFEPTLGNAAAVEHGWM